MRTSTSLSSFLGQYLNLLREGVFVVRDTAASEVFEQLLRIKQGDLFIGISFPRYSKHTVEAMMFARSRGAATVGITDGPSSPFNGIADVDLYAKSDMVSFLDSLVAPMSLINALIVAVGARSSDHASDTFKQLENIWTEYDVYEHTDR
jgi:DNA-binding MurR/RpiR family transcriptional regulator